jgi:hypothetical protein
MYLAEFKRLELMLQRIRATIACGLPHTPNCPSWRPPEPCSCIKRLLLGRFDQICGDYMRSAVDEARMQAEIELGLGSPYLRNIERSMNP